MPDNGYQTDQPLDFNEPEPDRSNNPRNVQRYVVFILAMATAVFIGINFINSDVLENLLTVLGGLGGIVLLSLLAPLAGHVRGKPYKLEHVFAQAFTYTLIAFGFFAFIFIGILVYVLAYAS